MNIKTFTLKDSISILALLVSVIALQPWKWLDERLTQPLEVSSYYIRRSYQTFKSDHIILDMDWLNEKDNPILVTYLSLEFQDISQPQQENKKIFRQAGFSSALHSDLEGSTVYRTTFELNEKSVQKKVIMFHIENYFLWHQEDFNDKNRYFQGGENYQIFIKFKVRDGDMVNISSNQKTYLFGIKIPKNFNKIAIDQSKKKVYCYLLNEPNSRFRIIN